MFLVKMQIRGSAALSQCEYIVTIRTRIRRSRLVYKTFCLSIQLLRYEHKFRL